MDKIKDINDINVCKIQEDNNNNNMLESIVNVIIETQLTINSIHHKSFYDELTNIWKLQNIQYVKYSEHIYKTNWKKVRSRGKKEDHKNRLNNIEVRIICINQLKPENNIVYILDYSEFYRSEE